MSSAAQSVREKSKEVSNVLRAIAHPVRLQVLCWVAEGEKTVGELTQACGISQSSMSQFLDRMTQEGVVRPRREGTRVYYSLQDSRLLKVLKTLKENYC